MSWVFHHIQKEVWGGLCVLRCGHTWQVSGPGVGGLFRRHSKLIGAPSTEEGTAQKIAASSLLPPGPWSHAGSLKEKTGSMPQEDWRGYQMRRDIKVLKVIALSQVKTALTIYRSKPKPDCQFWVKTTPNQCSECEPSAESHVRPWCAALYKWNCVTAKNVIGSPSRFVLHLSISPCYFFTIFNSGGRIVYCNVCTNH